MSNVRKILIHPDARLRSKCSKVNPDEFGGANLETVVKALKATVRARGGVGIAAPQIGINRRVFLLDYSVAYPDKPFRRYSKYIVACNPEIIPQSSETFRSREGCLSMPEVSGHVNRYEKVQLYYFDTEGTGHILVLHGVGAATAQHEQDHLDGLEFTDHMSKFAVSRAIKSAKKKMRKRISNG